MKSGRHFRFAMKDQLPLFYLITKGNLTARNYASQSKSTLRLVRIAAESRIPLVQIREKLLPVRLLKELLCQSVELCGESSTKILLNERFDVAISANADGVHLTSNSIPTDAVRELVPDDFVIGVSTHSRREAERARNDGADFATYGPVFRTKSKLEFGEPKGLAALESVCQGLSPFPIIALGGIRKENYRHVLELGAAGFAAITFLNDENALRGFAAGR